MKIQTSYIHTLKHSSLKKSRSPPGKTKQKEREEITRNLVIRQHYQENWSTKSKDNTASLNGILKNKKSPTGVKKSKIDP
jgi:hypothetical protein